ncbi:divisome protein SepX/GlpR [Nocardioides sp. AX2bis]|uniref:divisome protein SepX/GlpR n=1 Tax=Nocardioides sp. AX2bis TaxID=2653157 RepID=UPI0012F0590C|nr:hypothetical protein [Nocardioides sp. AX2bis]VXC16575.1 conserved membrane hypothetical protein [Nocardioides sp. AX2bis]
MDLSALIFVALAVAWAVYLVPKAIRHHDEVARSRSVDRFSATMRVLARREAVSARDSRLVVSPGRAAATTTVTTKDRHAPVAEPAAEHPADHPAERPVDQPAEPARREVPLAVRRRAAARAAARRRRVLGAVLGALAAVVLLAAAGALAWAWTAVPVVLLVAWLTACRMMVRVETGRAAEAQLRRAQRKDARAEKRDQRREARIARRAERDEDFFGDYDKPSPLLPVVDDGGDPTQEVAAVIGGASTSVRTAAEAGMWDPVPVTLPTYVGKAVATPRTVRTIDLDSTGVWTSGRSESDSALAREAEQAARTEKAERAERDRAADERRATGS